MVITVQVILQNVGKAVRAGFLVEPCKVVVFAADMPHVRCASTNSGLQGKHLEQHAILTNNLYKYDPAMRNNNYHQ